MVSIKCYLIICKCCYSCHKRLSKCVLKIYLIVYLKIFYT